MGDAECGAHSGTRGVRAMQLCRLLRFSQVGHTLGLRHNFIAAEDGHSSVMAYEEFLDTTDPNNPKFGAGSTMLLLPGVYDNFAIRYGYTPLNNEQVAYRHPALQLLANGQKLPPARFGLAQDHQLLEQVSSEPQNPLYATDEDMRGLDPRVTVFLSTGVETVARDKMIYAANQRKMLLDKVSGLCFVDAFWSCCLCILPYYPNKQPITSSD